MFNLNHRKVNGNMIVKNLGKVINVILLFSLILTSCKPVNNIQPQKTTEPTPLVTQSTDVPQQAAEYTPPVFVQPEPVIADNTNLDLNIKPDLLAPSNLSGVDIEDQFKKITEDVQ
jgi:hypothetical protein